LRILNDESDKKLDAVSIFLTKSEAIQLRGYLNQLLENPKMQHSHLSSSDFQKEITICLYDEKKLDDLHPRAKKLIIQDS